MAKILVVDDHPEMRELLVLQLKCMGFVTVKANNGKEGVQAAIAERPDLILMDLTMPVMDGWEATRILRSNSETKDIPILATTALSRPADLKSCIDAGCNDYIVKPFTVDQLRTKIKVLMT